MPRQARIDTPGALHHVICRGIVSNPTGWVKNGTQKNINRNPFGQYWV